MDKMNILIIEDEPNAALKLINMLREVAPNDQVLGVMQSTKEAIDYLQNNRPPHLAFVDIQLADDMSFRIFDEVDINFPVIFITAYDNYILKALEHNSIDYLLKPVEQERLAKAYAKVKTLENHFVKHRFSEVFNGSGSIKKRFLVKKGTDIVPIAIESIGYFFTEHKVSFLTDKEGYKYIIDKSMSDIEEELGNDFFRANRKYVIHIDAVEKFKSDNGKIALTLNPKTPEPVMVSKENAPNFRKWIEQ